MLFNKDKTTLICYPAGKEDKSYTVPDTVTAIGDFAFNSNVSLTLITLPEGVTSIGEDAFGWCGALRSIVLPQSLSEIGAYAFYECDSLECIGYCGETLEEWRSITIDEEDDGNECLSEDKLVFTPYVHDVSLTLDRSVGVNFYMTLSSDAEKVIMNGPSGKDEFLVAEAKVVDGYYCFTYQTSAKDIDSEITLEVLDASGERMNLTNESAEANGTLLYSVRKYLEYVQKYEKSSESLIALASVMGSYGTAAKAYFAGETVSYDGDNADEINEALSDYAPATAGTGADYYGSSLLLKENITLRHYFTSDPGEVTVSDGEDTWTLTATPKDGFWYVDIEGIAPAELDTIYTVSVGDWSLSYGVFSYCYKAMQSGSDNLKALVENLYEYHLAARDYFPADEDEDEEDGKLVIVPPGIIPPTGPTVTIES